MPCRKAHKEMRGLSKISVSGRHSVERGSAHVPAAYEEGISAEMGHLGVSRVCFPQSHGEEILAFNQLSTHLYFPPALFPPVTLFPPPALFPRTSISLSLYSPISIPPTPLSPHTSTPSPASIPPCLYPPPPASHPSPLPAPLFPHASIFHTFCWLVGSRHSTGVSLVCKHIPSLSR